MHTHATLVLFQIKFLVAFIVKIKYPNFLVTGIPLFQKYLMKKMEYVVEGIVKVL